MTVSRAGAIAGVAVAVTLLLGGCAPGSKPGPVPHPPASEPASEFPSKFPSEFPSKFPSEFPSKFPSKFPGEFPSVGSPLWAWDLPLCDAYQPDVYQAPQHRLAVEVTPGPARIAYVETYEPDWGARAVEEIRSLLRACASYEHGGSADPAALKDQHLIVENEFAGDESLLVETVRLRPPQLHTWYSLVVRTGDVVVTVRTVERPDLRDGCPIRSAVATCLPGQT
jgi:hypothetical protein